MQGDAMSRFFAVTVTNNEAAYEAPADAIYTVRFGGVPGMPSGWYDTITEVGGSSRPAVVVSDNVYTVEIAEQALSKPGKNALVIIISDATGYTLASWAFELDVQPTPGLEAPEVTTYYNLLAQQVAQVIASTGEAASSAAAAAQSATAAQNSATAAAKSQSAADKSASTAQTAAQSAQQSATRAAASESAAAQSATSAAEDASSAASDAQSAASDAASAAQSATAAQTAATNAQQSAADAAASAESAAQSAQQAEGFRSFFGGAVLPAPTTGTIDPSRPMQSAAAASVTATSRGDFIHSVTVNGFTTQAGSGDPSPTNVRAITNGGMKLVEVTFDGSSDENWSLTSGTGAVQYISLPVDYSVSADTAILAYCNRLENVVMSPPGANPTDPGTFSAFARQRGDLVLKINIGVSSAADAKQSLASNPITIWYKPADESQSTGLYVPVPVQGGEYRCQCLKITAPLCAGDSVVSKTRSGCDQQLALDGSTLTVSASGSDYTVAAANAVAGGTVYASGLAGLSLTAGSVTIPGTAFPSSVTNAEQANTWLQGNPQTLYYQSTAYTEKASIQVSLESHTQCVETLNNLTVFITDPTGSGNGLCYYSPQQIPKAYSAFQAERFTRKDSITAGGAYLSGGIKINPTGGQFLDLAATTDNASDKLNEYFTANPTKIVYELTSPITYAHPAVDIVAVPDDTGSYTVSSQDGTTVVVAFGGLASEAQGKKADTAVQTVNGQQGPSVTLSPQDVGGISTYTCTTSGKVHTLTGSGDNIKFVADAAYTAGNTIKVNGTTVTAQTQDGTALPTGAWAKGAAVVCWRNGTKLTVGGSKAYTPPAYSTSETATGETWIDGKPIYRKVYTGGALNKSTIDLGVNTQIDQVLRADFVVVDSTGNQMINPSGFINNLFSVENAWTCSVIFNTATSVLTGAVTEGVSPELTRWTIILHYTKK